MESSLSKKIKDFAGNDRPYPLLSGFVVGFYMLLFYYSNNFELGSSWPNLLAFALYFVLLPMAANWLVCQSIRRTKFSAFAPHAVFAITLTFFGYFLLEHLSVPYAKRISLGLLIVFSLVSFQFRNHKPLVVIIALMSVFPLFEIGKIIAGNFSNPQNWNRLPDNIADCRFKRSPNVYFLQMDGYANAHALTSKLYDYDNSAFDAWLAGQGFSLYDNFRSNYNSTLKSNSSLFSMMHHYSRENVGFTTASDYVMGANPVLRIFKNNGYRTFFISERPYFLVSRPENEYDFSNFKPSEVPYLKDGWSTFKPIAETIKAQVTEPGRKFFFIQKFNPGHIAVQKSHSTGIAGERKLYLEKLKVANAWLKEIVPYIEKNDPNALIIIGADHGGFVGMEYTGDAFAKITDPDLLRSIFGAKLAIRWNNADHAQYDARLGTSVNLFRTLFSFLSKDKRYLAHLQPDTSYNNPDAEHLEQIYPAIGL